MKFIYTDNQFIPASSSRTSLIGLSVLNKAFIISSSSKVKACLKESSVSSLHSKRFRLVSEQRKTEDFGRARNETRAKKMKVGRGGREGRKRLRTNPSILKTCVRQRTHHLIGSASRIMLTRVDQMFVS